MATLTIQSDGDPYVDGEPNIASNLCVIPYAEINAVDTDRDDRDEDIILGISAPYFPNETQEVDYRGKFYLWKFDKYLTDRVELAEFEGMNAWEALTQLCQLSVNYVMGFNPNDEGDFFLSDKTNSTYTTFDIISSDVTEMNKISINKDRGISEVFNYAVASPSFAKMSDIKKELYLSPRLTESDSKYAIKVDDIFVDVRTLYGISVKLICSREGELDKVYTNVEDCALFKWQIYERDIEVSTTGIVAIGATSISVASTFRGGLSSTKEDKNGNTVTNYIESAVNLNDYITAINPDNQEEESRKVTAVTGTVITVASSFTFLITTNTVLIVTHPFNNSSGKSSWSNEGVTNISEDASAASTIYVDDIRDLADYTFINVNDTFARISAVGDWSVANNGFTLTLSGNTVTCSAGDAVKAYWAPSKDSSGNYEYFQIGDLGVYLKIDASDSVSTEVKTGDRVTIISEGMKLEQNDQAKQYAYDMTSISNRGRLEYTGINNKFMRRTIAKHFVRKIVTDYKDSHYILTIVRSLLPSLRFIDSNGMIRISVYDEELFPQYTNQIGYPRSIAHDLTGGKTTIVVRCDDAY